MSFIESIIYLTVSAFLTAAGGSEIGAAILGIIVAGAILAAGIWLIKWLRKGR